MPSHLGNDTSASLGLDKVADARGGIGTISSGLHGQQCSPVEDCDLQSGLDSRVAVRGREVARLRNVNVAVLENVVALGGVAGLAAVEVGDDGAAGVDKVRLLDEGVGAHARVDARGRVVLVAGAVDVDGAEAHGRQARVDVGEVVVVVRDAQLAPVLAAVAVRVAGEGSLPLLVVGVAMVSRA